MTVFFNEEEEEVERGLKVKIKIKMKMFAKFVKTPSTSRFLQILFSFK